MGSVRHFSTHQHSYSLCLLNWSDHLFEEWRWDDSLRDYNENVINSWYCKCSHRPNKLWSQYSVRCLVNNVVLDCRFSSQEYTYCTSIRLNMSVPVTAPNKLLVWSVTNSHWIWTYMPFEIAYDPTKLHVLKMY